MPKTKFFRIGTKPITAAQFGDKLAKDLKKQQEEIVENVADIYVSELSKLIERLKKNSAERGVGFYAVRYNNPFEDAKVIAKKTPKGYRIYVDEPRFQYLDEGRPAYELEQQTTFPVYIKPTATRGVPRGVPGSLSIGQPAHIVALDGKAHVSVGDRFSAVREGDLHHDIQDMRWVVKQAGDTIKERKPRNYYLAIKKIVDEYIKKGQVTQTDSLTIRDLVLRDAVKTIIERR